jgi:hypothetical protein
LISRGWRRKKRRTGYSQAASGRLFQKALEMEMVEHLGRGKHGSAEDNSGDSRNGHSEKTVYLENREAGRAAREESGKSRRTK